ncbi:unnamed protein product [Adineta ricciae]|uniref:Uncharacterized protein n=1 Tax=Adineta ricciae TaxID=249248 RepID=A0A815TAA7_ADIRI|nr:unnamed protein product [Adineta ricciae]CAF1621118.1 unnamed protein product [Adineta ricciae]
MDGLIPTFDLLEEVQKDWWLVLLGNSCSGKTTYVRWLTLQFAEAIIEEKKKVFIHGIDLGYPRVPILIRINEFIEWHKRNPSMELFDYFGQHTWVGDIYCSNSEEQDMLKTFVLNGHSLIIFDEIDEATSPESRGELNEFLSKFMHSYTRTADYILPTDEPSMAQCGLWRAFWHRKNRVNDNVVICTGREAGYDTQPLRGLHITHVNHGKQYISKDSLCSFVQTWCFQVCQQVISAFQNLVPGLKNQIPITENWLKPEKLCAKIEADEVSREMTSDFFCLSAMCTLYARYGLEYVCSKPIVFYRDVVEQALQAYMKCIPQVPQNTVVRIFSELAFFITSHSKSTLIDEFDLKRLFCYFLQCYHDERKNAPYWTRRDIQILTDQLVQALNGNDVGMFYSRSLNVYGFRYPLFQEYFVALTLLENGFDKYVNIGRFLLTLNSRMDKSRLLAMGKISAEMNIRLYDQWCFHLTSGTTHINKYIPHGPLFFVRALNNIIRLPSTWIVYQALYNLLNVSGFDDKRCLFQYSLTRALEQLPMKLTQKWLKIILTKGGSSQQRVLSLLQNYVCKGKMLPSWITTTFCDTLSVQLAQPNNCFDKTIHEALTIISIFNPSLLATHVGSFKGFLLSSINMIKQLPISIFAIIISLYGGLERVENNINQNSNNANINHRLSKEWTEMICFSPKHIFKDSPLTPLLIEYLIDPDRNDEVKLNFLTDQCHALIQSAEKTDVSVSVIHSFVVLFCIIGPNHPHEFQSYVDYTAFEYAIQHMDLILTYIKGFFSNITQKGFNDHIKSIMQLVSRSLTNTTMLRFSSFVIRLYSQMITIYPHSRNTWDAIWRTSFCSEMCLWLSANQLYFIQSDILLQMDELMIIENLSTLCYVVPKGTSMEEHEIEILERNDLELLMHRKHPLQLIADRNVVLLLLAYIPKHLRTFYIRLIEREDLSFKNQSPLVFMHLVVIFLETSELWNDKCIRYNIILTLLLPLFEKYGLKHFILSKRSHIDQTEPNEKESYFSRLHSNEFFRSYANEILSLSTLSGELDEAIERAIAAEQDRLITALYESNIDRVDEQLYSASICLARLAMSDSDSMEKMDRVYLIDNAWRAAEETTDSLWKIDALITICRISYSQWSNDALEARLNMLTEVLEHLLTITAFHCYVAVFIRYLSFAGSIARMSSNIFESIWQKLLELPSVDQQAICQAFIYFPSIRRDVERRVLLLQWSKENTALSRVFNLCSSTFTTYFKNNLICNGSQNMGSTLIACMYLKELHLELTLLKHLLIKRENNVKVVHNGSSISYPYEQCNIVLESEETSQQTLSSDTALEISHFLEFKFIENTEHILFIQQTLKTYNKIADDDVSLFLIKWLVFRDDQIRQPVAVEAMFLLIRSHQWTLEVLDMCCEFLTSEDDEIRERAFACIKKTEWGAIEGAALVITKWLSEWNRNIWNAAPPFMRYKDFGLLFIDEISDIEIILEKELDTFSESLDHNTSSHYFSFIGLIFELSTNATNYLIDVLWVLSQSVDDNDGLFLAWLLKYIPPRLCVDTKEIFNCFRDIVCHDGTGNTALLAIIKCLRYWQNDDHVRSLLWQIIDNNNNMSISYEEIVVACIHSLYYKYNKPIEETELNRLRDLQNKTLSLCVSQATVLGLLYQVIDQPTEYTIDEVYVTFLTHISDYFSVYDYDSTLRAYQWIINHRGHLIPIFLQDMFDSMILVKESIIEGAVYVVVMDMIISHDADVICHTVRHSLFGEERFKNALYNFSKRSNPFIQLECLKIYSHFNEVSEEFVCMLMSVALQEVQLNDIYGVISKITCVQARSIVTDLLKTMTSSSLTKRYCAAKLLVRLGKVDQVSVIEVHEALITGIKACRSHTIALSKEHRKLECFLLELLHELCTETMGIINMVFPYNLDEDYLTNLEDYEPQWRQPTFML